GLPAVFFGTGWLVQSGLRRLARLSLERLQRADTRSPVLFLRAFRDDQVALSRSTLGMYGSLFELGRRLKSLDAILLEEGTPYGPVVGLGNPQDKHPPYGAARAYLDNMTWKESVADLAGNSAAIVICVDDTESIWWEAQHLAEMGYLKKTLFFFHP